MSTSCTFVLVHCTHIVSSHHKKMFHTFGTKTLAAAGQVINDGGARSVNVLIAKNNMQSVGGLKTDEKRPKQQIFAICILICRPVESRLNGQAVFADTEILLCSQ